MAIRRQLLNALRNERGATAAEFALVLTPLILLTIGTINLGLMIYTASALHYAVEDAARCATVKTATCANSDAVKAYAATRYSGPSVGVTFAYTTPSCGNQVTGTASYTFVTGLTTTVVPLSATACYPLG